MKKTILAISLFILGWTAPLSAEVMTYQGRLKESNVPVNANRSFLFELCATETPTGCVVSPDGAKPFAVQNGLFKSTFTLPAVDLSAGPWYLRVKVEGNYLSPVEKLTFVPYSLYASTAGYSPAALQKAGDTMTGQLTLSGSSLTLTGSEFSVGGSTLVVKGGNVGLGTAWPQYPLSVYGDTAGNIINVGDRANIGGDTAGLGLDSFGTYAGAALYANNVKVLNVEQNGGAVIGSTYMTADAVRNGLIVQGNVGIGTAVPNYALQISSGAGEAGTIMAVSTGATNLFWVAGDGAHSFRFTGDGSGLTGVTGASGTDSSKLPLTGGTLAGQLTLSGSTLTVTGDAFSVGGSTFVVVNGNVGIGTATPAAGYELHVMGQATDNGDVRIESGSGTSLALSALNAGYVNIQTALGVSNGGDLVLQAAAGNVGIGMVSPGAMLDVAGSGNFSGSVTSLSSGTFKATGPGQFSVETGSGILVQAGRIQAPAIQLTNGAAANYVLSSDAAGNATWVNPAAGGVGDGWVGNEITDAADATLVRSGAGIAVDPYKIALNLATPNTWTAGQTFNAGLAGGLTGAASMNVLKAGDTMTGGLTLSGSTLTVTGDAFSVGGSTLVVTNGYLGLGTSAPAARLHVVSDNGYLHFGSNSSLTLNMIPAAYSSVFINNNATGPLALSIDNDPKIYMTRESYVGVGTPAPSYRLHVSSGAGESGIIMAVSTGTSVMFGVKGNGEISGGKFIGDGSGLTNLPVPGGLVSIAGDTMTGQLTNISSVTITGNGGGAYGLGVSSNVSLAGALYSANGKVGIGTTTPTGKLHVYSPGQSRLYLDSPDDAAMLVLNSGVTGNFVGMTIQTGNTARWSIGENIGTTEIPNYTIYDEAAATSRFYINRSGNVGIGTTAPSYRLHISSAAGEAGTVMAVSTGATNLFWVAGDGAHAVKYFGDGSGLTGVSGADATKLPLTGGNLTGQLTLANSTLTVTGNAFSVAGSTLVVSAGKVGVGNANPAYELEVQGTIRSYTPAGGNGRIFLGDGDIAHGMTGLVPTTDTFGLLTANSGSGGLHVGGFSSGASFSGLHLGGTIGGADPTDTVPAVQIDGAKQSGVSWQPLGSLETILGVRNNGGANLLAVLGNGRVGIGVAAPDQKLTVAGNISQTGVLISSGAGTNYFAGDVTAARYQINGSTVLAILPGAGSLGIGPNAGRVNTADSNLFVGVDAGFANDSGIANTFVGSQAGYGNITGIANTFMGSSAGMSNTVGGNNSFFGNQAGFSNNGDGNAFFGSNAGTNNLGSNNVFIGANAGLNASGTGNIVIGYNKDTSVAAANSELNIGGVIYGNLAARTIGISTRVPQAALDIVSTGTVQTQFAQIWRDSNGNIQSSMSATGVMMASKFVGSGSGLTGVSATDATKLPLAGGTLSGQLTLAGSTLTVIGADGPVNAGVLWASTSTVTPALYVSTTGRVGIGTASPGYPLHVIERSGQVGIRLEGYDASADSIYIDSKNSGKPTYGYVRGGLLRADTQVDTSNRFNIKVNSLERLTITPQGFVGINDLSPSYLFHVSTTAGETGTIMAVSTGTTDIFWVAGDGAHATRYFGDGSGLTGVSATDATKLPIAGGIMTGNLNMGGMNIYAASTITATGDITAARYQINGSTVLAILPGAGSLGIGPNSGRVNSGIDNLFIGESAGYSNTTGTQNLFIGYQAGYINSIGNANALLGYQAGFSNTGDYNTFVGADTGASNTSGTNNTNMGHLAGYNNQTGSFNTILGNEAGYGVSGNSFSESTLVGDKAGNALTTGSGNILLGFRAGQLITNGADNIVIGYAENTSAPGASNELNIGGVLYGNLSTKTIGISTRTPQAALDIVSTATSVNVYAQIWRDSTGLVVASMTSTGRLSGDGSGLSGVTVANGVYTTAANTFTNTSAPVLIQPSGAPAADTKLFDMRPTGPSVTNFSVDSEGDVTTTGSMLVLKTDTASSSKLTLETDNNANNILELTKYGSTAGGSVAGGTILLTNMSRVAAGATGGPLLLHVVTNNPMHFVTNDVERMRIATGGNVGIAATSPTGLFQVGGGSLTVLSGGKVGIGTTSPARKLEVNGEITASRYEIGGSTVVAILPGAESLGVGVNAGRVNTGNYNVFVGSAAGFSNTTGMGNSFIGYLAGYSNTLGAFNSFIGVNSGYSNTIGASNSFLGSGAGYNNTAGGSNSFIGENAGYYNTTGANNSYMGVSAGYNSTAGSANAILGKEAGLGATNNSFSSSTLMGYRAGFGLSTGSDNILLGFQAGYNVTTGTGNIVIGYGKDTTAPAANNQLNIGGVLYGDLSAKTIGVSKKLPEAALDIISTGTAANVYAQIWRDSLGVVVASMTATGRLSGDGSGLTGVSATDNTKLPLAGGTMSGNISMGGNTINAAGIISAASYQINGNTVVAILSGTESLGIGVNAGRVNTGNYDVFVGSAAGYSNTTGYSNSFLGSSAGYSNTTGYNNLFLGSSAGYFNTEGSFNSFIGIIAGRSNTTGNHNSFLGLNTGFYNQTGSANAIVGNQAGYGVVNNSFSSSTLMGYKAGFGLTTGSDNILLGFQAGYNVTSGTGNIVIGYNKDTTAPGASNELNIGGVIYGNLSSGSVGVGVTNPGGALQVGQNGLIISTGGAIQTTGTGNGVTAGGARGNGAVDLQTFRTAVGQVASGAYSVVGGGAGNSATVGYSVVGGGNGNSATGGYSVVGGGLSNTSSNGWATVGGGTGNIASQNNATVGGGAANTVSSSAGTVAGGSSNNVQSTALAGFIGGGGNNISTGAYSTVGGGRLNTSSGAYSAVLGGSANVADGAYSGVAGGSSNRAYGVNSAVTGGNLNSAWGNFSTVSGGNNNSAAGLYSIVAGGDFNSAGGQGSAVVGGNLNNASGTSSFIGGGGSNEAKGWGAVVFGGNNAAMGGFSFAAGYRSTSAVDGTFTWSDSQGIEVVNNVQDQVMFKAKGGFWVSTGTVYGNPGLYVDANNRVGIGTTTALTAKLTVSGVPGVDGIMFPDGTLQTTAGLGGASSVTNPTDVIINGDSDSNQSGSVRLQTSGLDRVYVSTNGNIGIGTISPLVNFHNAGPAILANATTIDPDSYGSAVIAGYILDGAWVATAIGGKSTNAGTTWAIGHNNADLLFAAGDSTNPNTLQTFMQATWKRNLALVPVSGKVGIGTAAIPDQKLTVIGSISQTGVLISSGAGNNYFAGNVGIGTNTPVAMLDVNGTARLARHVVESRDSGGTMSADDFGKTITVNSASPQAIALPVGTAGSVGAQFTFVKLGTGKLTLNAGATDFIADSSMAGSIYNDAVSPAFATITLRLVTSNKWMLVGGEGAWVTQ